MKCPKCGHKMYTQLRILKHYEKCSGATKEKSNRNQNDKTSAANKAKGADRPKVAFDYEQIRYETDENGEAQWAKFESVEWASEGIDMTIPNFSIEECYNEGLDELEKIYPGLRPSNAKDENVHTKDLHNPHRCRINTRQRLVVW